MSCEPKDDDDLDERAELGIYTAEQVKAIPGGGCSSNRPCPPSCATVRRLLDRVVSWSDLDHARRPAAQVG